MTTPLLSVKGLKVSFDVHQNKKWPWSPPQKLNAVNGISFDLYKGKTLGIVGESGCGKSTLIRAISGLEKITEGEVYIAGAKIDYAAGNARKKLSQITQMIFQDPMASLNPRMTVGETLDEPTRLFFPQLSKLERQKHIAVVLDQVGISQSNINRYPHEFSGGQCQRIGIARALIPRPKLLICDEPVSALDVSVQAQVVNLLMDIQADMGLSLLFVAHDLGIVKHISDDIAVLYLGSIQEQNTAQEVITNPQHYYTQALLSAVPVADPHKQSSPIILKGELPSPLDLPKGCPFASRCHAVNERCYIERPELLTSKTDGLVSCHVA